MSKSKSQRIVDVAESLGWTVKFHKQTRWSDGKTEKYVEFSQYSPAGQDFSFEVFYDNLGEIDEKVFEFWQNYDIDEEVEMWLEAKRNGVSGVPSASVLVRDQEEIDKMIETLWSRLRALLR